MKNLMALIALLSTSLAFGANLNLTFVNMGGRTGNIKIAVFDNATDFSNQSNGKPVITKSVPIKSGENSGSISISLPNGDYAVSASLDQNNNGRLDTKLGIPSERFGFSNNPAIKFGAPTYGECEIKVEGSLDHKIFFKKLL